MKVLHLMDTFDTGFERDQIQVVRLSSLLGVENTVLTTPFDNDGKRVDKLYFRERDKRLSPAVIKRPFSLKLKLFHFSPLFIPLPHPVLFHRYDIIHLYTIGTYPFFLSRILRLKRDSRLVLRCELSSSWYHRLKESRTWRKLILGTLNRMDAVYVFSRIEGQHLLDLGLPANRVYRIPVSIDWTGLSQIERSDCSVAIGYLGRFTPSKGAHCLVSALQRIAAEYPGIRIYLAGPPTDAGYLDQILKSFSPYPEVQYLGIIPTAEFISLVDIVLVPSLVETGAISTLEAMASSKAVVARNISPINEYITHGISGFLVNRDEQYYSYCRELIENVGLRRSLGKAACQEAQQYDQNQMILKMLAMYDAVLKEKSK